MRKSLFLAVALCLTPAAPAVAQTTIPGLENFTLERTQPTPTPIPTPIPTPPPSPSPTASPTAVVARPTAAPTQRSRAPASATPTPSSTPTDTPTDVAPAAEVLPTPTAAASPGAEPEPAAAPTRWALWAGLAAVLLAGLAGFAWWRSHREAASPDDIGDAVDRPAAAPARTTDWVVPPPAPAPVAPPPGVAPPPPAPVAPKPGGTITSSVKPAGVVTSALTPDVRIDLTPLRCGVDTLRATLEYELTLMNTGRGVARTVSVEVWLASAGHETASDLQRLFAGPVGELMLPPFDLPVSAKIDLSGVAVVPREFLATITAGERRMFVPLLAARVRFADGRGGETPVTAAFLVGVERAGQERLAPLPLDRGSRMNDRLAARPFTG